MRFTILTLLLAACAAGCSDTASKPPEPKEMPANRVPKGAAGG